MTIAERTVRLARLHPAQQQILDEQQRFNVVALGRRSGKSTLAQDLLVNLALERRPGGYFAPTYKLLDAFWRELKQVLVEVIRDKSEQEHRLEVYGGGTIDCWSTDTGDPARGRKYALVIVDEAAMVARLADVWGQALRPTLADYQGKAWFMSTPRGLNDLYTLFQRGQDPLEPDWQSWQRPTSVNPFIAPEEIEAARHDLTEREFSQEFLAEFLTIEGAGVFRGVHAVSRLEPRAPERGHQYSVGIDWGRSVDFTVYSVLDLSTREQVLVDRFTSTEYEVQTARLHRLAEAYKPVSIIAEANAMGGPIVERLQRGYRDVYGQVYKSLPVYAWLNTNATKAAVIQALALAIENGDVTLLEDRVQTAELIAFESTVLPSGLTRYAAPVGQHDDLVIALALAYSAVASEGGTRRANYAFTGRR